MRSKKRRRWARKIEMAILVASLGFPLALIDVETKVHEDGSFTVTGCIARQMCDDR